MKKPDDSGRILRELNKHKGIDEAITAAELAAEVGLKERKTRQIISDIVKKQELLIASRVHDPCGFYFIKKAGDDGRQLLFPLTTTIITSVLS